MVGETKEHDWSETKRKAFTQKDMIGKFVYLEDTGEKIGTVFDVVNGLTIENYREWIYAWAESVWSDRKAQQDNVRKLVALYLDS